ncbi:hypothetical protein LSH36_21g05035, partial [Paralvinella palmiformis]
MSTKVMESQQRVVPSGKVYRQIFDAEVQLVRALEGKGLPEKTKLSRKDAIPPAEDKHMPVIRDSDQTTKLGLLTDRQCTWVEGFPNEGDLENPVLYKFFSEESKDRSKKPESSLASKEVRGLPDVVDPTKKGSDIIERISESRRQRHDAALEDMHQELGLISTDLIPYTENELLSLWDEISEQSMSRQQWIKDLDDALEKLEKGRMDDVCEVFRKYADMLRKIAYLMPPDLQRLLDKESQVKYMESKEVVQPPNVQEVLETMYEEQEKLNKERLELILSLRELNPPSSTKTRVYQWNEKLTTISKSLGTRDLIDRGVSSEEKANEVVSEKCLPLVGERQTMFEKQLESMDKELEQHNVDTLNRLKSLFKFSQGAAHVWDVHELGLAKQERALQEKLDQCRLLHDTQNQDREANLDIVMDKMRQDANEKALEESLKKVLEMLSKIKEGYHHFHTCQLEIVDQYPEMVDSELKRYDEAELEKEAKELEIQQQEAEAATSKGKGKSKKQPKSRASSRASADE